MSANTADTPFQAAVKTSGKLASKPSDNEMLELYGLYKQVTANYSKADKPGMFDLKNKHKYNAWTEVKDLKPEEAEAKYVEVVKRLKDKYGLRETS